MPSIKNLTYILPDGRVLLDNLTESFNREPTGLVGRNGAGKTVLAKLLAGLLAPSSGTVTGNERLFYLDQLVAPSPERTVADLAGVRSVLDALRRIESGLSVEADLELAENNWDMEERLVRELQTAGLPDMSPNLPALCLSGGECTRVALVGAFVSRADYLVLDEPTNHLDAPSKEALIRHLETWKSGLLVVSHDRMLLERMRRIVELSPKGLKSYGGGYALYAERKKTEQAAALERLESIKTERKRACAEQRVKTERQEHRAAQGRKKSGAGDMPRILLNAMKHNAEKTTGKLRTQGEEKLTQLAAAEFGAYLNAAPEEAVVLIPPECALPSSKIVLRIERLLLPWVKNAVPRSWTVTGPERLAVCGANGSGKTTLLRLVAGALSPACGSVEVKVPFAYLDQYASLNDAASSVENLRTEAPLLAADAMGTRLAQIGITGERRHLPVRVLSGGERLKLALLRALSRTPPPQLLLLDEPTNHLDLDSVLSVETLLNAYTGALIVVSHDDHFLQNIGIERRLILTT